MSQRRPSLPRHLCAVRPGAPGLGNGRALQPLDPGSVPLWSLISLAYQNFLGAGVALVIVAAC